MFIFSAIILLLISRAFIPWTFPSNVKYFETLSASQFNHNIVKRGANPPTTSTTRCREVDFKALGRGLSLILSPKKGLLHSTSRPWRST
ncbi:Uncharacterized protein FKW44_020396 [Caligus rogercresseyi]|uniref:Secreted protein n=1 Tax=Caligus rogercresseyi TaxID=217165 RepID=A0A7T8GX92_CALRO|nr:Uncharacterized protein FKW44_020396 [Caligus rogercresseyi]